MFVDRKIEQEMGSDLGHDEEEVMKIFSSGSWSKGEKDFLRTILSQRNGTLIMCLLFECLIYHYTVGEFFTNIDSEPALPVMDQSFEFRCTVILCNQWNNLLSRHYSIVPILNIHYYLELEHPILNQKGNRFLCLLHSYHCF